ncbi:MAG: GntR family transcriptional regulator [Candidatus Binatia bacterium]
MTTPPALRIRREPGLTMKIYEALSERIMDGHLKPGDPIIIEQVAAQLEVSPTPVRESLARLAEQGVITKGRNGRMSVQQLTPEYVRDIYLVRGALEGLLAELAAPRITETQIATLRDDLADILTTVNRGHYQQYIVAVDDIFGVVEGVVGSQTLSRELFVLRLHTAFVRSLTKRYVAEYIQVLHEELQALVDALADRDPAKARLAAERYVRNSGRRVAQILGVDSHDV